LNAQGEKFEILESQESPPGLLPDKLASDTTRSKNRFVAIKRNAANPGSLKTEFACHIDSQIALTCIVNHRIVRQVTYCRTPFAVAEQVRAKTVSHNPDNQSAAGTPRVGVIFRSRALFFAS
jgi:hypothetical protein